MGAGVLVLAWVCLLVGLGVVGPAVSSMVKGFGSMVAAITQPSSAASPSPSGSVSDAPVIDPPDQPITNSATVDLTVRVPSAVVGQANYICRVYGTVADGQPAILSEVPIGGTAQLVVSNLTLAKGANEFTASVVGPFGESAKSAPVSVTLDVSKPKITITSPKDGASISKSSVVVKGKTQPGSSVRVSDDANGATETVDADDAGAFSVQIAVAAGPNTLTVTVTDPAGNDNEATLTVVHGAGKLKVSLSASAYTFTAKRLPKNLTLTAVVVGADGRRVAGASALFTVSVPGLQTVVSSPLRTDGSGTATFSTSIPKGATAGAGLATVQITMPTGTLTATDRAVLTIK